MITFQNLLILILSTLLVTAKCEMNSDNVVLAINCGGETYKDSKGIIYEKVQIKKSL
jgi:hypothetical protein